MADDAIAMTPEHISHIGGAAARHHRTVAAIWIAIGLVAALGYLVLALSSKRAVDAAGMLVGVITLPFGLGLVGSWHFAQAARAGRAARQAMTDRSLRWLLRGNMIVASDPISAYRGELSFRLSAKLRALLTAVPTARIV